MKEVYIGKTIVIKNKIYEAGEFYIVTDELACIIQSSGVGAISDESEETTDSEGE
jgi:hypothetical protein